MGIWDDLKEIADDVAGPLYDHADAPKKAKRNARQQAMVDADKAKHPREQTFSVGAYGEVTKQEAVDLMVGGERGRQLELEKLGFEWGDSGVDDRNYDYSRMRRGDMTPDQMANLYVYQGSNEPNQWYDRNGQLQNSTRMRAQELDENIQAILTVQPDLANDSVGLMAIAMEPFVKDRLRGMDKAATWLQMRAQGIQLEQMPDEHEAIYFEHLLPAEQEALRQAGYVPVGNRPKLETGGLHNIAPGWGALGSFGEAVGVDAVYDQLAKGPGQAVSEIGGGVMKGMDLAQNVVNTGYRMAAYNAHEGKWLATLTPGSSWAQTWKQAWEGERFYYEDAKAEAKDKAGNAARYNMMVRIASGESIDEITEDFADIGTTEYADKYQEIKAFMAHPRTIAGIEALNRGKISPGRTVADLLQIDPESSGAMYSAVSGGGDFIWALVADPTLIAGRSVKMARQAQSGLAIINRSIAYDARLARTAEKFARLTSVANSQTLADAVRASRGGNLVGDVTKVGYWSDLARLPGVNKYQRAMVALADHAHAFAQGDQYALKAWGEAYPNADKMLDSFNRYLDVVNPWLPDGTRRDAVDLATVSRYYNTSPGDTVNMLDDVVDFTEDTSGAWALAAGHWTSVTDGRAAMPRLSRKGAVRLEAKMDTLKTMDWLNDWGIKVLKPMGHDDFDDTAALVAEISANQRQAGMVAVDDQLHNLRLALEDKGLDPATVQRAIDRETLRNLNLELNPGETPAHAIMRAMVTATNELDNEGNIVRTAENIRDTWKARIAMELGDEDQAAEWMAATMQRYISALGINQVDDEFRIFDSVHGLDQAVRSGVLATTPDGVAFARREYAKSLMHRNGAIDDPDVLGIAPVAGGPTVQASIDDSLSAYDLMVAEGRNARALSPVDEVAESNFKISNMVKVPLAHMATGSSTFARRLFEFVPPKDVLALDDVTTPRQLSQLLAFNIRGKRGAELYDQFFRAGEGGRRAVLRSIYSEMFGQMGILDDPRYADFVAEWMNASTQRYARVDQIQTPAGLVSVGHLPDAHYASHVAIPSFREVHANIKRGAFLDMIWGYGHKYFGINSDLANRFMNAWRASVVLRPAMIPRAGGEEFFAQTMKWGYDYALRQGVLARLHRVDPMVLARSGGNDALHADAATNMFGRGWQRSSHAIEAFGEHILDGLSPATRAAIGEDAAHAMSMSKLSPIARRGQARISGVESGLVPVAKIGDGNPLHGARSFDVVDERTGQVVSMDLRPSHDYTTVSEHDKFFRDNLAMQMRMHSIDEVGQGAAKVYQGYVAPATVDRIGPIIEPLLAVPQESNLDAVKQARHAFNDLPNEDFDALEDWLWAHENLETAPPLFSVLSDDAVAHLADRFVWSADRAPEALQELITTLGYNDFHALLATPPTGLPRSMGHIDELTVPGAMYRGVHFEGIPDDVLFDGRTGLDDLAEEIPYMSHSGPGVYITASGHYAERYVHAGAPNANPSVTRLRFRKGEPPKLIPYMDTALAPEMRLQLRATTSEMIGESVDPVVAHILRTVYDEHLDAEDASALIDDMADLPEGLRDDLRYFVNEPGIAFDQTTNHVPDAVHTEIFDHQRYWDAYKTNLNFHGLLRERDHANAISNRAFKRHVVDHFGAQGYRGIADHQPYVFYGAVDEAGWANNTNVLSASYWYPEDLEAVQEIPWGDSVANAILDQRNQATTTDIAFDTLEEADEVARAHLRQIHWRADRQYKLDRMDHASVPGGPRNGVQVQVPIIPRVTVEAILSKMAESDHFSGAVHDSGLATIAGIGPEVQRASILSHYTDPEMRAHMQQVLDRIEAGADNPKELAVHLATTDPDTAEIVLQRLREGVKGLGVDDDLNLVNMGQLDMTRGEWEALRQPGRPATARTPAEVGYAERSMPQQAIEAQEDVRNRLGRGALDDPARYQVGEWGGPVRFIDDNIVLERARSASVDVKWQAVELSDKDRAEMLNLLDREQAKTRAARIGEAMNGPTTRPVRPRSDRDIIQQIKTLRADHPIPDSDLPDAVLPYLEDPTPGTAPTTMWAIQPGKTRYEGVENMIDQAMGHAKDTLIGKDGQVLYGVTEPISKGKFDAGRNFVGRDIGVLPDATVGPITALPRQAAGPLRQTADKGMEVIGAGINWMSRHPIWRENFGKSYNDAFTLFSSLMVEPATRARAGEYITDMNKASHTLVEHTEMLRDTGKGWFLDDGDTLEVLAEAGLYEPATPLRGWITKSDGTLELVARTDYTPAEQAILKWSRQNQTAATHAITAAEQRATAATIPYIDDHKVRSQWAEMIHNVIPFWFAEEQFYKRWGRTFLHSPEALRRIQLTHHAMNATGFTKENEYGEEVFIYPGAEKVAGAFAKLMELLPTDSKWTVPIQAQMTGQLMYAAPGFDRIGAPSAGPMVSIPLRVVRAIRPEIAMPLERTLLGPRGVGRSLPEQVLPSTVYRFFNFATASDEDLTANTIGAIVMIEANHPDWVPSAEASAAEVDVYFERVRNHARIMQATKALLGATLPASPAYDFDPDDLSAEFRGYLQAGVPIEEAAADFLADHPDATPYTIFSSETPSKAPTDPTEAVYDEILGNEDFYTTHRASPWLLPAGEPTDPFDRRAWYELLANKIRTRKSDTEFYKDLKYAEAADEYFTAKEDKDTLVANATTVAERDRIRQAWTLVKDDYFATHRIFAENIQNPASHNERRAVLDDMVAAMDDERAPDVPQAKIIRELLHGYDDLQNGLLKSAGSSNQAERTRTLLRHAYLTWADGYSRKHPTALLFFRRILLPEVDTTGGYAADLEDTEEGAA